MSVAIVTGGASGMGFNLVKNLLGRQFAHVVIADLKPPASDLTSSLDPKTFSFFKSDVSDWQNQAELFKYAHAKHKRLDLVALNAGISDTDALYEDNPNGPEPLNLKVFGVNLFGPLYGFRQALWYMRRNPSGPSGKIIMTASSAGFYAHPSNPEYCSSKHAIVGLVRSAGAIVRKENITVNAVCPGLVLTPLVPREVVDAFPKEHWTPMSTIMSAFDKIIDSNISAETIECSGSQVYSRPQYEYLDEHMKMLFGSQDLFQDAYAEER
ncbi:hypothetical protein BZA70DRAFT_257773 [Myxozyma melibiosi]|uniref:NAD(P)-binding protein n=1 Tax=Myxozyma melibiosi TaxID=54550 RepID=A0ABR1F7V7_9ASCO